MSDDPIDQLIAELDRSPPWFLENHNTDIDDASFMIG